MNKNYSSLEIKKYCDMHFEVKVNANNDFDIYFKKGTYCGFTGMVNYMSNEFFFFDSLDEYDLLQEVAQEWLEEKTGLK